jgi:hypothetical protein
MIVVCVILYIVVFFVLPVLAMRWLPLIMTILTGDTTRLHEDLAETGICEGKIPKPPEPKEDDGPPHWGYRPYVSVLRQRESDDQWWDSHR